MNSFNNVQATNSKTWNHLVMYKQMGSGSRKKCYQQTIHLKIKSIYKQDLNINNYKWFICQFCFLLSKTGAREALGFLFLGAHNSPHVILALDTHLWLNISILNRSWNLCDLDFMSDMQMVVAHSIQRCKSAAR